MVHLITCCTLTLLDPKQNFISSPYKIIWWQVKTRLAVTWGNDSESPEQHFPAECRMWSFQPLCLLNVKFLELFPSQRPAVHHCCLTHLLHRGICIDKASLIGHTRKDQLHRINKNIMHIITRFWYFESADEHNNDTGLVLLWYAKKSITCLVIFKEMFATTSQLSERSRFHLGSKSRRVVFLRAHTVQCPQFSQGSEALLYCLLL